MSCPPGTYLPVTGSIDETDCVPCLPGHYCDIQGLANTSGQCDARYYCSGQAVYATPNDGISGNICPHGHYCPIGTGVPYPCRDGTYANFTGAEVCLECPPSYYCAQTVDPQPCPPGYFCPGGTGLDLQPCPRGTFSSDVRLSSDVQCRPCSGGYFCESEAAVDVTGVCAAGYYCEIGVDTATPEGAHRGIGGVCPEGHFCINGSSLPSGCSAGTYQDLTGQSSCKACPAGFYCLANQTTYANTLCPSGYFCPEGTTHSWQYPCPAGTYNPSNNSNSYNDCLLCQGGMYCLIEGLSQPSGLCSAGYYCLVGSVSPEPIPLTNSSISNYSSDTCPYVAEIVHGNVCPEGSFCPIGSHFPTICPAGKFCNEVGLVSPAGNCTAGFYCPPGSTKADQMACSPGNYCPTGTPLQLKCPLGTFSNASNNSNQSDCFPCTAGYFCHDRGLTSPTGECNSGYYCPEGQTEPTPSEFLCPPGHFCTEGTPIPLDCAPGTYQAFFGMSSCDVCPSGFFCDPYLKNSSSGVSVPTKCPPGFYCFEGTAIKYQYPCPPGTFSNISGLHDESGCKICSSGMYCEDQGSTEPTGFCFAGHYCTLGAISPTPVDNTTGGFCLIGRYCPLGSSLGQLCPTGMFNSRLGLTSADECQLCSPGMYCASAGLTKPTGTCHAGHFCEIGSPIPNPENDSFGYLCPPGHFCLQGTASPMKCPPGTFRADEIGEVEEDCQPCSAGFYCPLAGATSVFAPCVAGFYCENNASVPNPTDGITGDI